MTIRIGNRDEYLEAARAECEGMTREEMLVRIASLMRECDNHVNRTEGWRRYAGKLERESSKWPSL